MAGKRKRVVLTIKDKLDIIKKLEDGGSSKQLAGVYGIGETTVRDIRKNKEKLITYASSSDSSSLLAKRKSMKPSMYEELDRAMLEWFNQQRARGRPVSGPLCAKRAEFFFYALGMDGDFNPSAGWLTRFKQRHSIRDMSARRERPSGRASDQAAVDDFCGRFWDFLQRENLQPEQVYNADETGLFWRCLPARPAARAAAPRAKGAPLPSLRGPPDRVTVLCCANATGAHKLKLCVVGKAKRPRSFKATDTANLPVSYFSQKGAWMDLSIFRQWFDKIFVPQVREYLRSKGLQEKAVLLLDNSPTHPNENVLRSDDGQIFAKYLPPNVAALIQPSDQGVIATMKRNYRLGLLQNNLEEGNDLRLYWKRLTLLDALYEIAVSWNSVKPVTITRAWKKILPALDEKECLDLDGEDTSVATVATILQHTKGLENVTPENFEKWLEVDSTEPGYEVLSDSEIIRRAQGQTDESSENEEEEIELVPEKHINHAAALQWTENLLAYLEQQGDMILPDRLVIRKLRATIRNKHKMSNSNQ